MEKTFPEKIEQFTLSLRSICNRSLDFVFPPTCAVCGGLIAPQNPTPVCDSCWDSLEEDRPHYARTTIEDPFFKDALALYLFSPEFKTIVHLLKYDQKTSTGRRLGHLLASKIPIQYFKKSQLIIPVPIHHTRFRERGYNQAEVIAHGFSECTGIPVDTKSLRRKRSTQTHTKLHKQERRKNIGNAFAATRPRSGENILLIDDVMTTGATVNECAEALRKAGANEVKVLTAARA